MLVWSNSRVIKWVCKIGLEEYASCLSQSGIHGAVIALDDTFDADDFAYFLQIPNNNEKVNLSGALVEKKMYGTIVFCDETETTCPSFEFVF